MNYYGESSCTATTRSGPCKNKTYYVCDNQYVCGVHSRNKLRIELPKRSASDKRQLLNDKITNELTLIEEIQSLNLKNNKRGDLIISRLQMRKEVEHIDGFYRVFPNFRHQNRLDGFGCSALSPMSLGPVDHGQPNLPPSKNLENFHQGSKVYSMELDSNGNPSNLYVENRLKFYLDPIPHRHKYPGNTPVYFIWIDRNGKEHKLNYIQSRQFYCNFYERLVVQQPDFIKLRDMLDSGINLQICGYDGYPINSKEEIEREYLNSRYPFGHERMLYALLTLEESEYPWRKYKTFDF